MAAHRWNSNLRDILELIDQDEDILEEMMLKSIVPKAMPSELQATEEGTGKEAELLAQIPAELPILLRGLVVYPQTAVPLTIGQPRSIRLVDEVVAGEERLIGLISSQDPELEVPEPKDLYTVGTVAMIHRLFRAPDGTIRLVVQGLERFKVGEFVQLDPYLKAKITLIPETMESGAEIEALARSARDQFERISEMVTSMPRELVVSVLLGIRCRQSIQLLTSADGLAYAQNYSRSIDLQLHQLINVLAEVECSRLGRRSKTRSEIEKVQREYFLRAAEGNPEELGEMSRPSR
jgi:ATP-dependent Lon protease